MAQGLKRLGFYVRCQSREWEIEQRGKEEQKDRLKWKIDMKIMNLCSIFLQSYLKYSCTDLIAWEYIKELNTT